MTMMTILAVLLGGGGRETGGPNSLPPVPCIPNAFFAIKVYSDNKLLYLALEDSNSLISIPFHSSSNCISVAQMWQLVPSLQSLGVQLYLICLLLPYL